MIIEKQKKKINICTLAANEISEAAIPFLPRPPASQSVLNTRVVRSLGRGRLGKMTDADINDLIRGHGMAAGDADPSASRNPLGGGPTRSTGDSAGCGANEDGSRACY